MPGLLVIPRTFIAGTWVGFDNQKPLGKNETGAVAASPIWVEFMQGVLEGRPKKTFSVPDGVVFMRVDSETGKPATSQSEKVSYECFKEESPLNPLWD